MEPVLSKIFHPDPPSVNRKSIRNLIFDFGGVILNIDVELTKKAFTGLGFSYPAPGSATVDPSRLFDDLETGTITPEHFRNALRKYFVNPLTDVQIDDAWNALLLDIPEPRIRMLEALKEKYRIFLLSNSNEIHYRCYAARLRQRFGYAGFDGLFERAWFSHCIGMKKPSPEIFAHVLHQGSLDPAETLFIDDTLVHVEGARKAGILGYHLDLARGEEVTDLFQ